MINSSLKRLTNYFRLTEASSVTSFLLQWSVVLTLVGGTLINFSSTNASHTLAQCHYNGDEPRTGIQHARVFTGAIMIRTSDGVYSESVILLN